MARHADLLHVQPSGERMVRVLIPLVELVEHYRYVFHAEQKVIEPGRLTHRRKSLCERFAPPHAFVAARVLNEHGDITPSSPMFADKRGAEVRSTKPMAEDHDRSRRLRSGEVDVQRNL